MLTISSFGDEMLYVLTFLSCDCIDLQGII